MTIFTVLIGLILLDIIVFFHELGHFVLARISGVTVEAFSLGMGPVIFHKTIKGTDWRLSLFPIGGYCSMKGEKDADFAYENPEIALDKDSFYGIKPVFRALIGIAGPAANIIFAFFAFAVISITGYSYYSAGNTIRIASEVYQDISSPAKEAGLLTGDKIISINSKETLDFSDIYTQVASHPDEDIFVKVEREGRILDFTVHTELNKKTGEGKIGIMSDPETIAKRDAKRYSFPAALINGARKTGEMILLTLKGISILFKGVDITESISGPARVTTMLGDAAASGFQAGFRNGLSTVLQFMALISISLFIMNLLPIPVLDGFLVLTSLIEAVFRIRIPSKIRIFMQFIGIALIAILFITAISGDFHYFWELSNEK